jgi:hypothetical protein
MISKHRFQPVFVLFFLGLQFFATFEVLAQVKLPAKSRPKISTDQFTLETENKKYSLSFPSSKGTQSVPIPTEWLAPPEELAEEEEQPFSSFLYSKRVTSFPIGNGEIALHLSSFDRMTEGSMMGAGGRDVFLIFSPADSSLRPGLINLGVTKDRSRDEGCFHALMTHFLIADANDDGNVDIGIVKEEIKCPGDEVWLGAPSYVQHSLHWFLFTPEGWTKEENSSWTDDYEELPLVDIYLSPVDVVGEFLWGTYDPSKWMSPPTYTPTYRRKLQKEERRKPSKIGRYIPEQPVPKPNQQPQ